MMLLRTRQWYRLLPAVAILVVLAGCARDPPAPGRIDPVELGKLKSMIGDFCGRRSAAEQVRERLSKTGDTAKDEVITARAEKQLPKLEDLSHFSARHGAEALALLQSREAELLLLHRSLAKQEGTGHLHPE